jgi:hypothetical protein
LDRRLRPTKNIVVFRGRLTASEVDLTNLTSYRLLRETR